jgi:thiosulfate/3-mercaptopyruvate sulfurtransferase
VNHLIDARSGYRSADRHAFVEVAPWRTMAPDPDPITGSIPGALLSAVKSDFAGPPTSTSGHLPLPDPATMHTSLGLRPSDDVIVYARRAEELASATRAWFTLTWAGFTSVRVLDGGLPAWVRAGGPIAAPATRRTLPSASTSPGAGRRVLTVKDVLEISQYGMLLDSRPAAAYNGVLDQPRTGHVPQAIHAHSSELIAPDGQLQSPVELRKWFLSRGAIGGHEVGAYCGGGVSSSLLVFAAALLDQEIGLYVDSWSAWERDPTLPVQQGSTPGRSALISIDCL